MSRQHEEFELCCYACRSTVSLPVPATATQATCPKCGTRLEIDWRPALTQTEAS